MNSAVQPVPRVMVLEIQIVTIVPLDTICILVLAFRLVMTLFGRTRMILTIRSAQTVMPPVCSAMDPIRPTARPVTIITSWTIVMARPSAQKSAQEPNGEELRITLASLVMMQTVKNVHTPTAPNVSNVLMASI